MSKATVTRFRDKRSHFSTSKEAYIWLLNRFFESKPNVLEGDAFDALLMPLGAKRRYFGRTPVEMFAHNPGLAENPNNYYRLANALYADVNLSNDRKLRNLRDFAKVIGLREGLDWE
ncbi:MAG: hypothetical protein ACREUB_12100 [Burkholderiales bacterium]